MRQSSFIDYNLTEKEASKKLNIDARTLRKYRHTGLSPAYLELPSGHARYNINDLADWENKHRKGDYQQYANKKNLTLQDSLKILETV